MARSQETFSKKEKEKKKLIKARDKEQRKADRKDSAVDGSNLDNMLAYIDENGNITSTPPDPTKKKKINAEDIEVNVRRQEDLPPEDIIRKGTVSFFNDSKGFGFIVDQVSQESIFVHIKGVLDQIKERDKVTFEIEMGPKGPTAVRVKLI